MNANTAEPTVQTAPIGKPDTVINVFDIEESYKRPDFQIHQSLNNNALVYNVSTTETDLSQDEDAPKKPDLKSTDKDFPGKAAAKLYLESTPEPPLSPNIDPSKQISQKPDPKKPLKHTSTKPDPKKKPLKHTSPKPDPKDPRKKISPKPDPGNPPKQSSPPPIPANATKEFSEKRRPEYSPKHVTLKPQPETFDKGFNKKPHEEEFLEQSVSSLETRIPETSEDGEDQTNNDNKIKNSLDRDLEMELQRLDLEPTTPTKDTASAPSEQDNAQSSFIQKVKDYAVIDIEMLEYVQCEGGWMRKKIEHYVKRPTHRVPLPKDHAEFRPGTGYIARILEPLNRFFASITADNYDITTNPNGISYVEEIDDSSVQSETKDFDDCDQEVIHNAIDRLTGCSPKSLSDLCKAQGKL